MKIATRIILTICAFVASYFFIFWLPFSLIILPGNNEMVPHIVSLLIAVCVAIFVWKKGGGINHNLATSILLGGMIVGAIGFVVGFFGPMILYPQSNLGPLFGLFFTGPIGFLIGLIGGGIYWNIKVKKQNHTRVR